MALKPRDKTVVESAGYSQPEVSKISGAEMADAKAHFRRYKGKTIAGIKVGKNVQWRGLPWRFYDADAVGSSWTAVLCSLKRKELADGVPQSEIKGLHESVSDLDIYLAYLRGNLSEYDEAAELVGFDLTESNDGPPKEIMAAAQAYKRALKRYNDSTRLSIYHGSDGWTVGAMRPSYPVFFVTSNGELYARPRRKPPGRKKALRGLVSQAVGQFLEIAFA